jgi:hypothetical protein
MSKVQGLNYIAYLAFLCPSVFICGLYSTMFEQAPRAKVYFLGLLISEHLDNSIQAFDGYLPPEEGH